MWNACMSEGGKAEGEGGGGEGGRLKKDNNEEAGSE